MCAFLLFNRAFLLFNRPVKKNKNVLVLFRLRTPRCLAAEVFCLDAGDVRVACRGVLSLEGEPEFLLYVSGVTLPTNRK